MNPALHWHHGEIAIIGGLLLEPERIGVVRELVTPHDFSSPACRVVYQTILDLDAEGTPIDWALVGSRVAHHEAVETMGGHAWLAEILDDTPSAANIVHYCNGVRERGLRRRISAACEEAQQFLADPEAPVADALDILETCTFDAAQGIGNKGLSPLSELVPVRVDELMKRCPKQSGIRTGFNSLDGATGGLQPGELCIVMGLPSMGKTAFAMNVGCHVAKSGPVYLFSQEMTQQQVTDRALSSFSGIPVGYFRAGNLSYEEQNALHECEDQVSSLQLYVEDTRGLTPHDVYAKSTALACRTRQKPALIIVDYLQIMHPSRREATREREVGSISSDLLTYARRLETPIMAVSQLKRIPEPRKPRLSDLRDSGQIEQDSWHVWAPYRPGYWKDSPAEKASPEAKLLILKNRDGALGDIDMYWHGPTATFTARD